MKKTVVALSCLNVLLVGWAAALWLPVFTPSLGHGREVRYGAYEGLELVEQDRGTDGRHFVVTDEDGRMLFPIPLRNCLLDTRFHDGRLRFREQGSRREGFIDRQGVVNFIDDALPVVPESRRMKQAQVQEKAPEAHAVSTIPVAAAKTAVRAPRAVALPQTDLTKLAPANPFYKEAVRVLQGKLNETDAHCRRLILNYCEHFRTAYTTKDLDFLRQVFSDQALIIVGQVVKATTGDDKCQPESKVTLNLHTKRDYISRLSQVFAANKQIEVRFSDFHILRHPTMDGIYGVTLRQQYKSDHYADDGYLFLLWDFRDKSMPLIHVRTWQPASSVHDASEVFSIRDFNLE